ncbi:hypothetical protein [Tissierella sp.]|uniref:hypothetical protein n=1 Tax=Tissierella sp. TaxID=41274 RepID=UPI00303774D4
MGEKAAIYPFYPRLLPYIKHYNKLQDRYEITEVYAPQGLGLKDKDLSFACNHPSIGKKGNLIDNINKSDADILVLVDDIEDDFDNEDFFDIANIALQKGMKVNYYAKSIFAVRNEMRRLSEDYKDNMKIIIEEHKNNELGQTKGSLQTPVILVGGMLDEPDVLEVLLQAYLNLVELGLKVSVFTKTPFSLGTNFHSINALFSNGLDEKTTISYLKETLKEVEHIEQPDIILIETPDPIMEYNEFAHNGYGIRTYMLSLAVIPDSMINVIPVELCVAEYVEMVSKFVEEKYNTKLDGVHASNSIIDSLDVVQSQELSWVHIPTEEVNKRLEPNHRGYKIPIINVLKDDIRMITNNIINRLSC